MRATARKKLPQTKLALVQLLQTNLAVTTTATSQCLSRCRVPHRKRCRSQRGNRGGGRSDRSRRHVATSTCLCFCGPSFHTFNFHHLSKWHSRFHYHCSTVRLRRSSFSSFLLSFRLRLHRHRQYHSCRRVFYYRHSHRCHRDHRDHRSVALNLSCVFKQCLHILAWTHLFMCKVLSRRVEASPCHLLTVQNSILSRACI